MKLFGKFSLILLFIGFITVAGCSKKVIKGTVSPKPINSTQAVKKPVVKTPSANIASGASGVSVTLPAISSSQLRNLIKSVSGTIFSDVHFDFDKALIKSNDIPHLNKMAAWLKSHPRVLVRIAGNCDERGTEVYNIALGWRRADSVKNYFISLNVSENQITTVSYGKDRPIDPEHNKVAWAKNRRDSFVLSLK